MGIKAQPPDPLNAAREKDRAAHHPGNLLRGLTHLPLPSPHPFLNTYRLLENTIKKGSSHPERRRWGAIFRETGFPPSRSQASLHLPLLFGRLTWLAGGGVVLNFPEQRRARKEAGEGARAEQATGRTARRKSSRAK